MYRYRSAALASLVAQLRRGPTRLRLAQLYNAEFLLSVIETGRHYPLEFVCSVLTGYRPRPGSGELPTEGQMLAADVLRSDLVVLAEDLSGGAGIRYDALGERVFTVQELAARFDVSTKTIFRWHRRGLIGWRVRFPDRRSRLVFPERCVRRFVAANTELVARGSSFSQLTAQERAGILAQARQLVEAGELTTVNAVARAISASTGRAVETIRLMLKHYDEAHPGCGLFNRSRIGLQVDVESGAIWEAYQDGVSIATLAARFGRPAQEIYRLITQMRARELASREIEYVPSGEFEDEQMRERILNDPAAALVGERTPERRIPRDLPPYLQQLFRTPLLTRESEYALFRKFNYLKFLADRARRAIDPQLVSASELDRIEALLDEAAEVKKQIVQANLRLVVSIAKRHLKPGQDFFELISDGNISLMRAVDKFDFTRGFKFSTYASWAIIKNFARSLPEQQQQRERYQTGREDLLETCVTARPGEFDDEYLPVVRGVIERMLARLDERESEILRQRFGLSGSGGPQTLEQVGRNFGVSKERVRQLESRAIARLRGEFRDELVGLLGA